MNASLDNCEKSWVLSALKFKSLRSKQKLNEKPKGEDLLAISQLLPRENDLHIISSNKS